ncbi:CAP domain-containing protein [Demequina globuliformis]|uniref:CAP domain-containing protein n=1 Tax=Demequina globuliformis TaxID=676202 RepID=UPI000784A87D|nr:CAP domain-containing protein [Demequina globuliformis]
MGAVALGVGASACDGVDPGSAAQAQDFAQEVFAATNTARETGGLAPLAWSDCLADAASQRAEGVKDQPVLEHAPLAVQCTDADTAGENLSRVEGDAYTVVERWMGSPTHEANVMSPAYEVAGVACVPVQRAFACSWLAEGTANDASVIS